MSNTNPITHNILRNISRRENGLDSSYNFQLKLFAGRHIHSKLPTEINELNDIFRSSIDFKESI